MDNNTIIDMADDIQKYCVSYVTMCVAKYGAGICIESWNEHYIRGIVFFNIKAYGPIFKVSWFWGRGIVNIFTNSTHILSNLLH